MDHVLSSQWRKLSRRTDISPPPVGLDRMWHQASGLVERFSLGPNKFLQQADGIKCEKEKYSHLSDRKLQELAARLRDRFIRGRDTLSDQHKAFAIVCETAARTIGLRPYREQIAGAIALNSGCIAEMATGEGKTLVATLSAVLAGWRGRGCHVITANDYLAKRDAELMNAVYRFCGLTVGCITPEMAPMERKHAYNADVTYCTNKEAAADFLRDRLLIAGTQGLPAMILSKMLDEHGDRIGHLVQRGLEHAIVDEADSVLIDEASSPLLISGEGPNKEHIKAYEQAARLAGKLGLSTDYCVTLDPPDVYLTHAGKIHLCALTESFGGLWAGSRRREELTLQALVAKELYCRDKHYVVDNGRAVIVDEFTGRLMPDRTWRDGLHQAVEAKEGIEINLPKETYARISFQRFFRLYKKLSGMSGTVSEARGELWGVYKLPVVSIPTHRPCKRKSLPDRVFTTEAAKWKSVVDEIRTVHQSGRPILVGTGSIRESDDLSARLTAKGISHCLMNAVQEASEAKIIAKAGKKGQITVSTNMAGRGTDIKLGSGVADIGGLHVIATARFAAQRIDRQLSGRCSRQGDPGSTQTFISLEDELIQKDTRLITIALRRMHCYSDRELHSTIWRRWIEAIQKRAERLSFGARRDVLAADNWLDQHMGFTAKEV